MNVEFDRIVRTVTFLQDEGLAEPRELQEQTLAAVRAAAADGEVVLVLGEHSEHFTAGLQAEVRGEIKELSKQAGIEIGFRVS